MIRERLVLACDLCPGDVLTLTAAVESLHASYPGEYMTDVRTYYPDIWQNNPHITPLSETDPTVRRIDMAYPSIHCSSQRPVNFIAAYTDYLSGQLGRPLTCTVNRPHVYLSEEEKSWMTMLQEHHTNGKKVPFWLVNAGRKNDYTIKQWPVEHYQAVIDQTQGLVQWVQVGKRDGGRFAQSHPALRGVIDLVDQTSHRMLHRLAYHATGGLGSVSYLLHLCAAFEKPYIYIAGGREPLAWINYPVQHTLHTMGQLSCCKTGGCWRSRVVKLNDGESGDGNLCEQPIIGMQQPVARCMAMIRPEEVVSIIKRQLDFRA